MTTTRTFNQYLAALAALAALTSVPALQATVFHDDSSSVQQARPKPFEPQP